MKKVVADLENYQEPEGYVRKQSSPALFHAVHDLVSNTHALRLFDQDPDAFMKNHSNLSAKEKRALRAKSIGKLSAAAKTQATPPSPIDGYINHILNTGSTTSLVAEYMKQAKQPGANTNQRG